MKAIQKRLFILTVVCMLISSIIVPVSASASASSLSLTSTESMDQKVVLYYPNGDWGLTPVEITLSVNSGDNVYLAALRQLTKPDTLPVGCYAEFPESFNVEDVSIVKDTAYVTISDTALKDSELSDGWLNTLGDIISYNLFYMNKEINSVQFLSSEPDVIDLRNINNVEKSDLFSAPIFDSNQSKDIPMIDFDYESLAKMSDEERNQTIHDAINKVVGTLLTDDYTVCIDPGHGGYDPGAVVGSVYEKNLNLTIALAIRDYLEGIDPLYPQFNVLMTRTSDVFVSLSARHDMANNGNADVFISIHCNTSGDTSVRGVTARYPNNHDVALSINLANSMISVLTPSPLPKHSDAAYQNIQVLRNTTMPATLVECGFMTNSSDLYVLQNQGGLIGYYLGLATNVWCQVNI